MSNINETLSKHVKSASSGGDSVTVDENAAKAEQQYLDSKNKVNIINRRVRKTFGVITGARP